jgi:hypothetical protein
MIDEWTWKQLEPTGAAPMPAGEGYFLVSRFIEKSVHAVKR